MENYKNDVSSSNTAEEHDTESLYSQKIKAVDKDYQANDFTYEAKKSSIFESEKKLNNINNEIYKCGNKNKRFNTDCNYTFELKNIASIEPLSLRPIKNSLFDDLRFKSEKKINEKHYCEFNNKNNFDVAAENNNLNNFDYNNINYCPDSKRLIILIYLFIYLLTSLLTYFRNRIIIEKNFQIKELNISHINQLQNAQNTSKLNKFNKETLQFSGNGFLNVNNNTNQETSKIRNNLESKINIHSNSIFPNISKNDTSVGDMTEKYCVNCFIDIPIRGKHCKICQSCIATFDHHCVWLGNCIGENNRKLFLLFLFLHSLELIFDFGLVSRFNNLIIKLIFIY